MDDLPGPLIGVGRSADVYDAGNGRVLRRYRFEGADATFEARVMRHVRDHGFPVPEVYDANGPDLVMERISGITMLEALGKKPWTIARNAALLADLHDQLHEIPAPDWLPETFGGGDAMLHLDLHPLNVLLTGDGPVVIDWPNTRRGPALGDVAHSWVVLATGIPSGRFDRALASIGRTPLLRTFLARYPREDLLQIVPAVAERWLADRNVGERERRATHALVSKLGLTLPE